MTRDYAAVFIITLNKAKYRRLSPAGRGALLHLWLLSGTQDPEATWDSRDELLDAFELDGFAAEHVDEVLLHGWIDIELDGRLTTHNWDKWQLAASLAIQRSWEASRKRDWRRKKTTSALPSPDPNLSRLGKGREGKNSTGHVRDMSGTRENDPPSNHMQSHVITGNDHPPGNGSPGVVNVGYSPAKWTAGTLCFLCHQRGDPDTAPLGTDDGNRPIHRVCPEVTP